MEQLYLAGSVVAIGLSAFAFTGPAYRYWARLVERFELQVQDILAEMFMFDITPRTITLMAGGFAAFCIILGTLALGSIIGGLLGAALGVFFPGIILWQLVKRRRAKLETQLLDGLITLANGMRAGLNLAQSMALIEEHSEAPLSQEFGLIMREIEHGTSVDVALDNASRRLKSHNFRLLFAAMKTTRLRGGNMPETLDRLSESLREIVRLEEKVKAQTAQGRMSAIFMGLMPFAVMGLYYLFDPEGVSLLFTDSYGHMVLAVAALLNVGGFLWIRRIVAFEI